MTEKIFINRSKAAIVNYYNAQPDAPAKITENEVLTVWQCKALQNYKATFATAGPDGRVTDGMYYEATYNGNKGDIYLDVYKKQVNVIVHCEED